jgi:hypothetical protein
MYRHIFTGFTISDAGMLFSVNKLEKQLKPQKDKFSSDIKQDKLEAHFDLNLSPCILHIRSLGGLTTVESQKSCDAISSSITHNLHSGINDTVVTLDLIYERLWLPLKGIYIGKSYIGKLTCTISITFAHKIWGVTKDRF